jgi:hypothetical protein
MTWSDGAPSESWVVRATPTTAEPRTNQPRTRDVVRATETQNPISLWLGLIEFMKGVGSGAARPERF